MSPIWLVAEADPDYDDIMGDYQEREPHRPCGRHLFLVSEGGTCNGIRTLFYLPIIVGWMGDAIVEVVRGVLDAVRIFEDELEGGRPYSVRIPEETA